MILVLTHIFRLIFSRSTYIDYFLDLKVNLITFEISFKRYCIAKHRTKKLIYQCAAPVFDEITHENR